MADIQHIIIHYLDGSATPVEKQELLQWLHESEENKQEFGQIRDLWLSTHALVSDDKETDEAFNILQNRIFNSLKKQKINRKKVLMPLLRIASIFLLAFGLNYLLFNTFHDSVEETRVVNRLITSENSKGRFVLPDSTVVWLNKNSMLEYPEKFSRNIREVRLTGGAWFEVTKKADARFQVLTDDVAVEVTGTSFVVQNYAARRAVETVLLSGGVTVDAGRAGKANLIPGQLLSVNKISGTMSVDSVNTGNYTGWIHSKLVFDNHRLSDIIVQMQQWYGIDIVCPEDFARQKRVTFTIRDESVEDILKAIQLIIPVRCYWQNGIVYIEPKR